MPDFIPGLQLSEAYYSEAVKPILDRFFPGLAYAAARIGHGSEVLGFDTPVSRDHHWGPQMELFLDESDFERLAPQVDAVLRDHLPVRIRGYSTNYSAPDLSDSGTRSLIDIEHGPVNHMIDITTVTRFWQAHLCIDPFADPTPADWMTFQEQELLLLTAGKVFHDEVRLEEARRRFAYYPQDVWLYLLASEWAIISQEEAFVGRTWSVDDELGSKLVAARQIVRLMHLCFLYEKKYAPYSKWFGFAFKQLDCYPQMGPWLDRAAAANTYQEREQHLAGAYSLAVELLNGLKLVAPISSETHSYANWHLRRDGVMNIPDDDPSLTRPHRVIFASRISEPLYAAIRDPEVLALFPYAGSINQFMSPASDALQNNELTRRFVDDLKR